MSNRKKLKAPIRGGTLTEKTMRKMHEIQSTFAGKFNGYICETCDKGFLTMDIDHGTTPMFMQCFATEGCEGKARSLGYPEGDPPEEFGPPIIHWVKPAQEEMVHLPFELRTYVERGGLIRRASASAPDWVKEAV